MSLSYWLLKVVDCPSSTEARGKNLSTYRLSWEHKMKGKLSQQSTLNMKHERKTFSNQLQTGHCNHEVTFGHTLPLPGTAHKKTWFTSKSGWFQMVSDLTNNDTSHLGYPATLSIHCYPQVFGPQPVAKDSIPTKKPKQSVPFLQAMLMPCYIPIYDDKHGYCKPYSSQISCHKYHDA